MGGKGKGEARRGSILSEHGLFQWVGRGSGPRGTVRREPRGVRAL